MVEKMAKTATTLRIKCEVCNQCTYILELRRCLYGGPYVGFKTPDGYLYEPEENYDNICKPTS